VSAEVPLDEEEFARWRREADRALQGARVQAEAGLHNWACFAAEQASQLAMKGLLHGLGKAPWGHDLKGFGEAVEQGGLELSDDLALRLRRLGRHYIPARYPDVHAAGSAGDQYEEAESSEAIADAEAVLAFVDASWDRVRAA